MAFFHLAFLSMPFWVIAFFPTDFLPIRSLENILFKDMMK
jgi:hypothetical protein